MEGFQVRQLRRDDSNWERGRLARTPGPAAPAIFGTLSVLKIVSRFALIAGEGARAPSICGLVRSGRFSWQNSVSKNDNSLNKNIEALKDRA